MNSSHDSNWRAVLLPGVAMMLGWGLRGFIGGGPFGAMIPGAMVALCICLMHNRRNSALVAAFGAVGIGIGGEMTYGQTVGFIVKADTFFWGLAGLTLKGAVWGFLGGAILAMSFLPRLAMRLVASSGVVMAIACYAGWKLINEPKLIYFSNRLDRPRPEIWAGFLLAGIALLLWLHRNRVPQPSLRFAIYGLIGGGIGFGAGGAIQGIGRIFVASVRGDWWKYMEFTFGFCFGVAMALAARNLPQEPEEESPEARVPLVLEIAVAAGLTALTFWWEGNLPTRFSFLLIACILMCVAHRWTWAAWQIAITMTVTAFAFDSAKYYSTQFNNGQLSQPAYAIAIAASLVFAVLFTLRAKNTRAAFIWLLWSSVGVASLKFAMHPSGISGVWSQVNILFLLMAVACAWMLGIPWSKDRGISHPSHVPLHPTSTP
ncbi:MAG: hypothetical protein JNL98_37230 [Bryobacterales bacterium]|nr:hypothetical protein [Bryobacterales bacterium]